MLEVCAGAGHIGLLAAAASDRALTLVDANEVACDFADRRTPPAPGGRPRSGTG